MKLNLVRYGTAAAAAVAIALSGCGGGGGSGDGGAPGGPTAPPASIAQALSQAAALPANSIATNPPASFSVVQAAGMPAVTIKDGAAKVNFAVFVDGKQKTDLALANVSFALAKLVPGTGGDPDRWVSYVNRTESTASGANKTGPGGVPVLPSALQATLDPKFTAGTPEGNAQLVRHPDGYYTYTFRTDVTNPAWTATVNNVAFSTNNVTFEPGRTHRVAYQFTFTDAAGKTVRVNPTFDFTLDANGNSVPVSGTRKMIETATCNNCHDALTVHGSRVETQYCVMCHSPSTVDAQSGNNLNLATMVHKIHSGRMLYEKGEHYRIWGNQAREWDYSHVGFPQPTRNCAACHTSSNPATPQGDNWKSVPTKEACLSCHLSGPTSKWSATHVSLLKLGTSAATTANTGCASCHGPNSQWSPERVHWVQEMANASLYKAVIESVTLTKAPTATATGTVSVKYAIVNPATGAAYDLREGCNGAGRGPVSNLSTGARTAAVATVKDAAGNDIPACNSNYLWDVTLGKNLSDLGTPPNKFGTFAVYVGAENLAGVTANDVTATTNVAAYQGVPDAANKYTTTLTVPAASKGNMRVMIVGAVSEQRLNPISRGPLGANPPVVNSDLAYVPVKNAIYEFNLGTGAASTAAVARRQIVSNDSCNTCHGILGLPTAAVGVPGFHKGVRNNSEGCAVCHNANQSGGYTLMADATKGPSLPDSQDPNGLNTGSFLHESYHSKRFVHGIHASGGLSAKRVYPFTHCMNVPGEYNKDGTSKTVAGLKMGTATCVNQYPGETLNFATHVEYPTSSGNCAKCHVNDSWKQDRSVLGSVVFKPTGATALDWYVISPKAATCTSCHDSKSTQTHVKTVGATFGSMTQRAVLGGQVFESCEGCHVPGSALGVDVVHRSR
jgi:OmcA/MtrC family decaheme c-type cytochrome